MAEKNRVGSEKTTPKQLDIEFYISKFGMPLLEKKWIILAFLVLGVFISLLTASFIRPQYISEASVQINEPASEFSGLRDDRITPKRAGMAHVKAIEEKLKSKSFAQEVIRILPEELKKDLQSPLDLRSQIMFGYTSLIRDLLGEKWKNRIKGLLGREEVALPPGVEEDALIRELETRVGIRANLNISMIWITGATLERNMAPILVKSYLDVLTAVSLEENKASILAEIDFLQNQREGTRRTLREAERELADFRRTYQIPPEVIKSSLDQELQLRMDLLRSNLDNAKERLNRLERELINAGMREAGVKESIAVLSAPMIPLRPTKSAKAKVMLAGVIGALAAGMGIVLLFEQLRGTIRYESDITESIRVPILGQLPRLT